MNQWWSFFMVTIGVTGLFFVFRRPLGLLGPSIGLLVQLIWIGYAVATGQPWFLVSAVAYGAANVYGIQQRMRPQVDATLDENLRELHRPFGLYDECECDDKSTSEHVNVLELGPSCIKLYDICQECCTDNEYQTEDCAGYHEHAPGSPICSTRAVMEAKR